MNRRPKLQLIAPNASPDEAAAVVAALERFMRDTAPPPLDRPAPADPWRRAALLESTGYGDTSLEPWGDAHPWGKQLNT